MHVPAIVNGSEIITNTRKTVEIFKVRTIKNSSQEGMQ